MKDAGGHGSDARGGSTQGQPGKRGQKFLGMGGKADPYRPVIWVHQGPGQVFGHFMGSKLGSAAEGQKVDRGWAQDMVGRGKAQFRTIPVRDQAHSDQLAGQHRSEANASADEYNRDLALRARNGQVGSGMKFRG